MRETQTIHTPALQGLKDAWREFIVALGTMASRPMAATVHRRVIVTDTRIRRCARERAREPATSPVVACRQCC